MQNEKEDQSENIGASITPWLSVNNGEKAVAFYKEAFDAVEVYRLEDAGENIVVND